MRIPYRDCKLTRVLKDALGGQSISLLVCNLAPGANFVKVTSSHFPGRRDAEFTATQDTINTIQ